MEAIGYVTTFAVLLTASVVVRGWVLMVLWGWFVVPEFHAPQLHLLPAIGLALMVTWLHPTKPAEPSKKTFKQIAGLGFSFLLMDTAMTLLLAWAAVLLLGGNQ